MKNYMISRSKDELGNNVSFTWTKISYKEKTALTDMTKREDFRRMVDYPYGFTFMSKGYPLEGAVDFYIVISSEQGIPQELAEKVSDYIHKYNFKAGSLT